MPIYEYQCKSCGHALEAMQKVNDSPLRKCPECGKSTLQRLMSAPVFRLKGGGWYETDFKTDKDGKRNLADQPDADAPKEDKKDTKDAGKEAAPKDAPGDLDPGAYAIRPHAQDPQPPGLLSLPAQDQQQRPVGQPPDQVGEQADR